MATSFSPSNQWFFQWAPPPEVLNHQFIQQPLQNTRQLPDYPDFNFQNTYPRAEPFKNQVYSSDPQDFNFNHQYDQQPNHAVSHNTPNRDLALLDEGQQQFLYQDTPVFHSHTELFPKWTNNPSPEYTKTTNSKKTVKPTSLLRMLPALMTVGLLKGDQTPVRGDQTPQAPDPDRDLGGPPPLRTLYQWKLVDFKFNSDGERQAAIDSKEFVPLNTLPLGIEVWKDRVFVTFPRWRSGVPCTLATVPRAPPTSLTEPLLEPYPNWTWHRQQGDCLGLTSVFRISADKCGRLWVLDSGQVEALGDARQVCPPQILAFDLNNDRIIGRWPIPENDVRQNSLFTNIVTDIRDDNCDDVHVYFTDVWRFSILVFKYSDQKFWRFDSHLFYPDPLASDYTLHGINFQWSDGVFGISMTPVENNDRTLYYHPMSSYREFRLPVSMLRNETAAGDSALIARSLRLAGESRGYNGQSSASAIARNGVMFYNLVLRDAVGCWDSKKPYKKETQGVVASDHDKLIFPNDLKIDQEENQSVWILSNKLPTFIYRQLKPNETNFRIMREYVDNAVVGSICDPKLKYIGDMSHEPECH